MQATQSGALNPLTETICMAVSGGSVAVISGQANTVVAMIGQGGFVSVIRRPD